MGKRSREQSAGVLVPAAKDRASWLLQVSRLGSSWDGDVLVLPRPRHATRWSSTVTHPLCILVRRPRWSPMEMGSGRAGRRGFLRSSPGEGLQVPPQWKPSYPHACIQKSLPHPLGKEALQCPTPLLVSNPTKHLATSSNTREGSSINHCLVRMKAPNSHGHAQKPCSGRSRGTAAWPTISTHFVRFSVFFRTHLLESGD